jgi:hypothetical protein
MPQNEKSFAQNSMAFLTVQAKVFSVQFRGANPRHTSLEEGERRNAMLRGYRRPAWLAAAMALLGVQSLSSTASANLLTNSGFESPDASAGDQTENVNWSPFNAAFATRSVTPHSGSQTLKTFGPFSQFGGAGVTQGGFAAAPGQSWSASCWLRDDSSDPIQGSNFGVVQLQFLDASNAVIVTDESPHFTIADPINTWELETANGVAPANTAFAQITLVHVQLNSPVTGGSVFWDDASLDKVPEPGSLAVLGLAGGSLALRRRRI